MFTLENDHAGAKSTQANEVLGVGKICAAIHVERGAVHAEVEFHFLDGVQRVAVEMEVMELRVTKARLRSRICDGGELC